MIKKLMKFIRDSFIGIVELLGALGLTTVLLLSGVLMFIIQLLYTPLSIGTDKLYVWMTGHSRIL